MEATFARERIRYCTKCRGMLIAMDKFLTVIAELRAQRKGAVSPHAPDPRELRRRIDCPQCHQRMDTHFYGGPGNVVIDDCERCSLNWLDHGELMTIVNAPGMLYQEMAAAARFDAPAHRDPNELR
jgi:Zn-finger nucleic acid-binding protein